MKIEVLENVCSSDWVYINDYPITDIPTNELKKTLIELIQQDKVDLVNCFKECLNTEDVTYETEECELCWLWIITTYKL